MTSDTDLTGITALPRRPEPPDALPAAGRKLWREIVSEYPARHFRGANLMLLEQLCRAHAFAKSCDRVIARRGLVIGTRANPAVAMRATAWTEIRACVTKLRLSISGVMRADNAAARPDPKHGIRKPWE
jgi:P27 family predicted phage terminase small subunit